MFNQYQIENAVEKIEGYLLPRPDESMQDAFERAKAECLTHLRAQIEHVQSINAEQFAKAVA